MFANPLSPRACLGVFVALVLLASSAPRAAQAQGGAERWQRCSAQDEICRVPGPAKVRYGTDGRYAYKSVRNRIICDEQEFGDPFYGQPKQCDYSLDSDGQSGDPSAGEWVQCATEGQPCRFEGVARVRYGTDNRYEYRNARNEIFCSVKVFGDPAYGKHKACEYQVQQYTGPLRPEGGWEYCAGEGGFCHFSGPGEVRYGAEGQFLTRRAINGMPCNVQAFGRDPVYGKAKQCFVRTSPR
jgi:hypothetical protein